MAGRVFRCWALFICIAGSALSQEEGCIAIVDSVVFHPAEIATTTNVAFWTFNVTITIPAGCEWELDPWTITLHDFRATAKVPIDPATVTAALGVEVARNLEVEAENRAYKPTEEVLEILHLIACKTLHEG